ncbi:MAG: rhodanese-like domain-containing protein [Rudanella sp.]|nr:rhodanese-like domain-containing protein [Rudanella sp.]
MRLGIQNIGIPDRFLQPAIYTDIDLNELETLRQQPGALVIDVRDEWEFAEFNLGGINVPLNDIRARKAAFFAFDPLIVICTNGVRSRIAAKDFLRQPELQIKTIYHLHGGLAGDVT